MDIRQPNGRPAGRLRPLPCVGEALDNASSVFAESTLTVAEIRTVRRKLNRTLALERKRYKQLYRSIGAVPAAPDGSGGGEEEAPDGEGSQPA